MAKKEGRDSKFAVLQRWVYIIQECIAAMAPNGLVITNDSLVTQFATYNPTHPRTYFKGLGIHLSQKLLIYFSIYDSIKVLKHLK